MNNTPLIFWIVPLASLVALGFAWYFFRAMMRCSEGTDRMKEIAAHVRQGAMAYLRQQYKVVTVVFLILALFFAFLAYGLGVQNPRVSVRIPHGRPFLRLGRERISACGPRPTPRPARRMPRASR